MKKFKFVFLFIFISLTILGQNIPFKQENLEAVDVFMSLDKLNGIDVLRVVKDDKIVEFDEPTFVKIKDLSFQEGVIEVKVLSRLLDNAPDFARGFIGVAFHISDNNDVFQSIYLRPTNARAENQLRRNHSIQYFAYPDYKFQRLRVESPEMYESYSDFGLNEWIAMRIIIKEKKAKLFLNENRYPSLIVDDLKLGNGSKGSLGMFVDVGTEGFFKDLKVTTVK